MSVRLLLRWVRIGDIEYLVNACKVMHDAAAQRFVGLVGPPPENTTSPSLSFESGVLARLDKLIELQTEGPATPKVPDVADAQFLHGMRCSARLTSLQRIVQMQNAMLSHPHGGGTKPEEVIFMLKELHRLISEDLS